MIQFAVAHPGQELPHINLIGEPSWLTFALRLRCIRDASRSQTKKNMSHRVRQWFNFVTSLPMSLIHSSRCAVHDSPADNLRRSNSSTAHALSPTPFLEG